MLKIVIPQRQREHYLKMVLPIYEHMLNKCGIDYRLVVLEQVNDLDYNLGKSINVAFDQLCCDNDDTFCFIPVDSIIDLSPESVSNSILCNSGEIKFLTWGADNYQQWNQKLQHILFKMSEAAKNENNFLKPRIGYNIFSCHAGTFERIGGMTNLMEGWGSEDNCLAQNALNNIELGKIYLGNVKAICLDSQDEFNIRSYGVVGGSNFKNIKILNSIIEQKIEDKNLTNARKDYSITEVSSFKDNKKITIVKADW